MKICILLLTFTLLASLTWANPFHHGEPGCQTDEEVSVKFYRHLYNKTLYWECVAIGEPAILRTCPVSFGFLDPEKKCVNFSLWYWTTPVLPPSLAGVTSIGV